MNLVNLRILLPPINLSWPGLDASQLRLSLSHRLRRGVPQTADKRQRGALGSRRRGQPIEVHAPDQHAFEDDGQHDQGGGADRLERRGFFGAQFPAARQDERER